MLREKVKDFIVAQELIEAGDLIVVGVSGGPDSMALLHILADLKPELQCELAVAHLNHGLRATAGEEQALVEEACTQLRINYYSRQVDVAELARQNKQSLEEAGRDQRYQWFRQLKCELKARQIATAHHQDDVAETVLLHLLRGAGIRGLRGIMPSYQDIIRPLLTINKEEILKYLNGNGIKYCLDESNSDLHYWRNRVRHGLLPYLQEEFNPAMVRSLSQLASIAACENEALENESRRLWPSIVLAETPVTITLNADALAGLHLAYQRRLVLLAFERLTFQSGWSMDDVEKVLVLSRKPGSSKTIQLKNQVQVSKVYDKLVFTTQPTDRVEFCYPVPIPGRVRIEAIGKTLELSIISFDQIKIEDGVTYLDAQKMPANLVVRSRLRGDIFRPYRMPGTKKLKKYLIDLKIPSVDRDRLVVVAGDECEIYAVLGLDVSRQAAPSSETTQVLKIKEISADKS